MGNKTIFIADADHEFCSRLATELDDRPGMEVLDVACVNQNIAHHIEQRKPDIVLLDVTLLEADILEALQPLKHSNTMVVLMSYFVTEILVGHAIALGSHYFIEKPFETSSLLDILLHKTNPSSGLHVFDNTEIKITETLREMGIPSHLLGFRYVREAVILVLKMNGEYFSITKRIYPEIAQKYSTTPSRVERAIRHAIEIAWNRGDTDVHYSLFHNTVSSDRGKPTNSEFIATLADDLLIQKYAHQTKALSGQGTRAKQTIRSNWPDVSALLQRPEA